MPSMPLRRKKWTEEEEETLISKYGELLQSGFLSKTKSRERKFEPIAGHVNALFHAQNPVAYPWLWTWKDASTKVQNMRHQYLGVKQKIRKMVPSSIDPTGEHEEFEWRDGLTLWPNFLKYKAIFGDQELDVNEFFTHPPVNTRVLPLRHNRPRPLLPPSSHVPTHSPAPPYHPAGSSGAHSLTHSPSSGFPPATSNGAAHSLAKDFIDNGPVLANPNGGMLLGCVKDAAAGVLDADPGDLPSSLNFEYDADGDEHGLKDACDEYEDDDDGTLEYTRQKRRRQWGRLDTGLDSSASEPQILSYIAGQFAELRDRETKREEREIEREKEKEKRWALLIAERETQKHEWERERREMEQARRREAERSDADSHERELKRSMLEQQWREIERERDRAREEKMERDKMEWREKMETQAMQHQAAMIQVQLQIAQCVQSSVAMLSGALSQIAGQANDVTGQASSVGPFFSQLMQNLQTHGTGIPQCGIRRGTGESSDSQFDVDG
eukprot:c19404_g1_i1 orf=269-1762(+)